MVTVLAGKTRRTGPQAATADCAQNPAQWQHRQPHKALGTAPRAAGPHSSTLPFPGTRFELQKGHRRGLLFLSCDEKKEKDGGAQRIWPPSAGSQRSGRRCYVAAAPQIERQDPPSSPSFKRSNLTTRASSRGSRGGTRINR